ncbi:MAG: hypothetical protein R3D43_05025 [Tepidamorphaceae bacterium]
MWTRAAGGAFRAAAAPVLRTLRTCLPCKHVDMLVLARRRGLLGRRTVLFRSNRRAADLLEMLHGIGIVRRSGRAGRKACRQFFFQRCMRALRIGRLIMDRRIGRPVIAVTGVVLIAVFSAYLLKPLDFAHRLAQTVEAIAFAVGCV